MPNVCLSLIDLAPAIFIFFEDEEIETNATHEMMKEASIEGSESYSNMGAWLIRSVIAVNFIRFALSFSSRFEGNAGTVGVADQLFQIRWAGFRVDLIWLVISTVLIFIMMFYFFLNRKNDSQAKSDALACLAWVVAFIIFIERTFSTGVIDFG